MASIAAVLHMIDQMIGVIISITGALLIGLVLPALLIIARAGELAEEVVAGKPTVPYELLNVPVLDVSARRVAVSWIGPANQRPPLFGVNTAHPVHALLLGRGEGTVFVEVIGASREMMAFPTAFVMTQSEVVSR